MYLNELDQYIKQEHKIKHYLRYCDDFLLFHNDKKYLLNIADALEDFLIRTLELTLKKRSLFPVSQGVDFVGYRHFPQYILIRKSTTKRVKRRLKKLPRALEKGQITIEHLRSSLASTMGWLKWANAHNLSLSIQLDKLMEFYNAI